MFRTNLTEFSPLRENILQFSKYYLMEKVRNSLWPGDMTEEYPLDTFSWDIDHLKILQG